MSVSRSPAFPAARPRPGRRGHGIPTARADGVKWFVTDLITRITKKTGDITKTTDGRGILVSVSAGMIPAEIIARPVETGINCKSNSPDQVPSTLFVSEKP